MNLPQALEHATALSLPGFMTSTEELFMERAKNEEAIALLLDAYMSAPTDQEPFDFSLIMGLAEQNRQICDLYGIEKLDRVPDTTLARKLSDQDLVAGIARIQRKKETSVAKKAGPGLADLNLAYLDSAFKGTILGIDIETTDRYPDRGYIVNLGLEFWQVGADTVPHDGHTAYFGLPEMYKETGVPLERIHHITWQDIQGKAPFTQAYQIQEALLEACKGFVLMAHNAAFEDSWLTLHLKGYAQARKRKEIVLLDSRDMCRRLDPDYKTLPRESSPASLEVWAKRRGVLKEDEKERHLGQDDVDLMFKTVQAQMIECGMLGALHTGANDAGGAGAGTGAGGAGAGEAVDTASPVTP